MSRRHDPLADPAPLIRSVHTYVVYQIGAGADADDVTGEVFARAVRSRSSYDPARGEPAGWLRGIARQVLADRGLTSTDSLDGQPEAPVFSLTDEVADLPDDGRAANSGELKTQLWAAGTKPGDQLIDAIPARVPLAARAQRRSRAAGISLAALVTAASLGGVSYVASTVIGADGALRHLFSGHQRVMAAKTSAVAAASFTQPTFVITATPINENVPSGNSAKYTITTQSKNGFSNRITLSASPRHTGITSSFASNTIPAGGSANLLVSTTANLLPGMYPIEILATSGPTTKLTTVAIVVR